MMEPKEFLKLYEDCRLCPRACGVNRLKQGSSARSGFCKESAQLRVAYVGAHWGEEPPISGKNGSGTIFFSGCSLKCSYCQNYQISRDGLGRPMDADELFSKVKGMIRESGVHNVNLVTPDHFLPHAFDLTCRLRRDGFDLPVVYNLSGYQAIGPLKSAESFVDIYLPDFKYSEPGLSMALSKCRDYPSVALDAIAEMVRQKGFLDVSDDPFTPAKKGVLVRHLILPGHVENSLNALTTLFLEFGRSLPLSLMSQYHPVIQQQDRHLNAPLAPEAFEKVYAHANDLGFEHLYVQFPDENARHIPDRPPFLPDFRLEQPFAGRAPRARV